MSKSKNYLFSLLFFLFSQLTISQEKHYDSSIEISYLAGHIIPHHDRFIPYFQGTDGNCRSLVLTYNKHTFGEKDWQRLYNYPTYGFLFSYQNNSKPFLGDVYSLMFHYTYYLYKRKLFFRIADGLSFATNPYNKVTNKQNVFMTSTLLNGFQFSAQYKEEDLWNRLGFQLGGVYSHYSNGGIKINNQGLNSWYLQAGLNYSLGKKDKRYLHKEVLEPLDKYIHYNFVGRSGVNENLTETGYHVFYNFSFFLDKRLSKKRAIQCGIDYNYSPFLKEWIDKRMPNEKLDFRRLGIFVGHEYLMENFSFPVQLAYYIYNPSNYRSNFYQRLGVTYSLNQTFYVSVTLKTHWSRAEAIEYGVGVRF